MPELPEVEIVVQNLNEILNPPMVLFEWKFFRKDLRFTIPKKSLISLCGERLLRIHRRAKYILFEFKEKTMISHLGMTGSWRVERQEWDRRRHDHVAFRFSKDRYLVYEDARRFGFLEVVDNSEIFKRFKSLGSEPLDVHFDVKQLITQLKKLNSPIKTALMNQKYIVGIGNIYASEILFRCGLSPLKKCQQVTHEQYAQIVRWTQKILKQAIMNGGSSIENYRNGFGEAGSFQNHFQVYGRNQEECFVCSSPIQSQFISGRSTFWCPKCQK